MSKGLRFMGVSRPIIIVVIVLAVTGAAVLSVVAVNLDHGTTTSSSSTPCSLLSSNLKILAPGIANNTIAGSQASFTIIESDPGSNYEGMNGSAYHVSTQWPVIQVRQGQSVTIHIYNCASSESHGFAIIHYFNAGVPVAPGHSYTLTFVANEAGTFRIFCNIFCAIHPLMQNGELIVTPN